MFILCTQPWCCHAQLDDDAGSSGQAFVNEDSQLQARLDEDGLAWSFVTGAF